MSRQPLPNRRDHITQKAKIGARRTIYLSIGRPEDGPEGTPPAEVFIRIRGNADSEKVVAYDVIARLISLLLQHGAPIHDIGERLLAVRDNNGGPVRYDDRIKMCDGTIDYIGRHLLVYYGGRHDLAHVQHGDTSAQEIESPGSTPSEGPKEDPGGPQGKTYCPVSGNH